MLRGLRRFKEAVGIPTARIARPRLAIEAVVSNGVVKAVRCKAEIDAGVEVVFIGVPAEEADARLKKADKPHGKTAVEVKAAYPRVEKIQPAEETKAAERLLEVERQAEYVVEGLEKEEAGFETGCASVDHGRFAEEGVRQFPYTWVLRTGFYTSNCSAA